MSVMVPGVRLAERLDEGERPLEQVSVHLEAGEARREIALLTDALDDLERLDFSESHGFLAFGESEAGSSSTPTSRRSSPATLAMEHTEFVFDPSSLSEEQYARWWQESGFVELRQILYWMWDPIHVNNAFPHTHDEYDRYAKVLLSKLRKGASASDVVEYLVSVEKGPMGMKRAVDLSPLGERVMEWYGESIRTGSTVSLVHDGRCVMLAACSSALRRWLSASPSVLRFPTDCSDPGLLQQAAVRAAESDAIDAASIRAGRGSCFDIEVVLTRGSDVSRARAALVRVLPPDVSIVGGPSPFHGAQLGS
jgi:hypothetical protein